MSAARVACTPPLFGPFAHDGPGQFQQPQLQQSESSVCERHGRGLVARDILCSRNAPGAKREQYARVFATARCRARASGPALGQHPAPTARSSATCCAEALQHCGVGQLLAGIE
eukprot:9916489-Alexandrium_andersonii.AAC.1